MGDIADRVAGRAYARTDQANCANVPLGGGCTITNTLIAPILQGIPALSEWAMILLAGLLAMTGIAMLRGRARH